MREHAGSREESSYPGSAPRSPVRTRPFRKERHAAGGGGRRAGSFAHSSHQRGQSITQSFIQGSAVYNSNTVRHHFMVTPTIRILSEMALWNETQLGIFHEHQQHHKTEIFFQCHLTAPKNDWLRITVKVLMKLKYDY